jgi:hypothetical protein
VANRSGVFDDVPTMSHVGLCGAQTNVMVQVCQFLSGIVGIGIVAQGRKLLAKGKNRTAIGGASLLLVNSNSFKKEISLAGLLTKIKSLTTSVAGWSEQ